MGPSGPTVRELRSLAAEAPAPVVEPGFWWVFLSAIFFSLAMDAKSAFPTLTSKAWPGNLIRQAFRSRDINPCAAEKPDTTAHTLNRRRKTRRPTRGS